MCSCADVIPFSATDTDHDNNCNDSINYTKLYRNNNNCNCGETDRQSDESQKQQLQLNILPNPLAVLKTVAALIVMDCNPRHQNVKNLQQQHEFQMPLQEYQNHLQVPHCFFEGNKRFLINKKTSLSKQRRCMLLANNASLPEEEENETEDHDENKEEKKIVNETCTKEQMMEFENSNYDKFYQYDNHLNSGGGGKDCYYENGQLNNCCNRNGHNVVSRYSDERKEPQHKYIESATTTNLSLGNLYNQCKLKTFQKVKLNLVTHHGNARGGASNRCYSSSSSLLSSSMDDKTLQTIVETDNDVTTGGTSSPLSSGVYQIINEKYKKKGIAEFSLKVVNSSSSKKSSASNVSNAANIKYKLFDLSFSVDKSSEKSQSDLSSTATLKTTTEETETVTENEISNTVSKRIEFFEHVNIPNGGIIKPKSNIYSIYRVNDNMVIENEQLVKNVVKISEAGSSKRATVLLRHDSHTLTIILSCVFIATFLLLVFFPMPG